METQDQYLALSENKDLLDVSKITKDLEHLKNLIDPSNKDFQNDKIAGNAQRALLSMLIGAIPTAIETYKNRPGQGSAYSLTNMITQINELFQEIRSTSNLENQAEYIKNEIIDPMAKNIIAGLFDITYYIKQYLKTSNEFLDNQQALNKVFESFDEQLRKTATLIDKQTTEAGEKLNHYLLEL